MTPAEIIADILEGWSSENPSPEAREAFAFAVLKGLEDEGFVVIKPDKNDPRQNAPSTN